MDLQLTGIHHLTAITAQAPGNRRFYTGTLGLRLIKKTVNQDDTSAYHLFYGDGQGAPGSDVTFFDWPIARERRGTHSIVRTGLRVADEHSLAWWRERLTSSNLPVGEVRERAGHATEARPNGLVPPLPSLGRDAGRRPHGSDHGVARRSLVP